MASHLLRTPLSSIYVLIDLLQQSDLNTEEQHAMLDEMREQSRRMKRFIGELLEMSRVESGLVSVRSEAVALPSIIRRAIDTIREEEPAHTFRLVIPDKAFPLVAADPCRVELIVLTLLRNAGGRCCGGGEITVELKHDECEATVSIIDDGEIIPVEQLHKLFWQFYPVDDDGKMPSGYHLGLYTLRRLVELQRGCMWAQSRPAGMCFSFSLPIWG
jgi:two-component system sensor histidine kinase KdpD